MPDNTVKSAAMPIPINKLKLKQYNSENVMAMKPNSHEKPKSRFLARYKADEPAVKQTNAVMSMAMKSGESAVAMKYANTSKKPSNAAMSVAEKPAMSLSAAVSMAKKPTVAVKSEKAMPVAKMSARARVKYEKTMPVAEMSAGTSSEQARQACGETTFFFFFQ